MSLSVNQQMQNAKLLTLGELLELNQFIVEQIKQGRAEQARQMKRMLSVGSKVSFENNDSKVVQGEVIKIMRKFARVKIGSDTWRVPLNLLTLEMS